MRFVLTLAVVWGTAIAPQLCRIGALTACCADDPLCQPTPETTKACAPTGCDRGCQRPSEEPAAPVKRDCGTCEDYCGAVVKLADAGERTSHLQAKLLAGLPAAFGADNCTTNAPKQHPLLGTAELPRLPRPSSDFPLLI